MHTTQTIENFKKTELKNNTSLEGSWHNDVKILIKSYNLLNIIFFIL